jgi:hypothetical protein
MRPLLLALLVLLGGCATARPRPAPAPVCIDVAVRPPSIDTSSSALVLRITQPSERTAPAPEAAPCALPDGTR